MIALIHLLDKHQRLSAKVLYFYILNSYEFSITIKEVTEGKLHHRMNTTTFDAHISKLTIKDSTDKKGKTVDYKHAPHAHAILHIINLARDRAIYCKE